MSLFRAGMLELGERFGFNLTDKKMHPTEEGGGGIRVGPKLGGWVGLIQNTPAPLINACQACSPTVFPRFSVTILSTCWMHFRYMFPFPLM